MGMVPEMIPETDSGMHQEMDSEMIPETDSETPIPGISIPL